MLADAQGDLRFLQFAALAGDGRLQHAIFTRHGGVSPAPFDSLNLSVSVKDDPDCVFENRARAYGLFGRRSETVVHAHLVHGDRVARVTRANDGDYTPQVDGLITNEPGCALTMNFADCAPILVYDPVRRAIGLGHAGWKGAVCDLPGSLVRAMQQAFGSDPAQLLAAVGPCIGVARYEVGEPVITAVHHAFPDDADALLAPPPNGDGPRPHFNLSAANVLNLRRAGVRTVLTANLCTAARTDLFYSHRAEQGQTGRFGVLMMLDG